MPTSTWCHVSTVLDEIYLLQPKSILDIGIGTGRWGFLAREVLDIIKGRIFKEQWQTKIFGVEIFERYVQDVQQYVYDKILIQDAYEAVKNFNLELKVRNNEIQLFNKVDLIIAGDVIEHFEKSKAQELINLCLNICKNLIVCIPLGENYKQGAVAGNEHETHRSIWNQSDFTDSSIYKKVYFTERIKRRPYGFFCYKGRA